LGSRLSLLSHPILSIPVPEDRIGGAQTIPLDNPMSNPIPTHHPHWHIVSSNMANGKPSQQKIDDHGAILLAAKT
jgi:hypothetical protein